MGWNDFHRRQRALDAVLDRAARNPAGPLPFAEAPGAAEVFASRAELLRALHYRWLLRLGGRISVALAKAERDPGADQVEAVSRAWRATAAEHPVLRAVLDANADRDPEALRPAVEGEQRLLALTAGLAAPDEPREEVARVGAAFLALLRTTPPRSPRRRATPVDFLRRLVASA